MSCTIFLRKQSHECTKQRVLGVLTYSCAKTGQRKCLPSHFHHAPQSCSLGIDNQSYHIQQILAARQHLVWRIL